ncbi:MAG: winged helix-turn-helix transcriptional regulator [Oligoflexales bacterium]
MLAQYQIDETDCLILSYLQKNARLPYTEIAKKISVSSGTIHQRINKMTEAGLIKGSQITLDYNALGYDVSVLIGIHLSSGNDLNMVCESLKKFTEVTQIHYTTGSYGLIIKVVLSSISDYYEFLVGKLQTINSIQSTESFICLRTILDREIQLI